MQPPRVPRRADLLSFRDDFRWGLSASIETAKWVSQFKLPEFAPDYEMVSVSHPDEFPMNEGRVISSGGVDVPPAEAAGGLVHEMAKSGSLKPPTFYWYKHAGYKDVWDKYLDDPLAPKKKIS